MVKIHVLYIELRAVSTLTAVLDTCWVAVSALQHGPVLNHPLVCIDDLLWAKFRWNFVVLKRFTFWQTRLSMVQFVFKISLENVFWGWVHSTSTPLLYRYQRVGNALKSVNESSNHLNKGSVQNVINYECYHNTIEWLLLKCKYIPRLSMRCF